MSSIPPTEPPPQYPLPAARPRKRSRALLLVIIVAVALYIGFGLAFLIPDLKVSRSLARRATCMKNLSEIGNALAAYERTHNGAAPSSLLLLVKEGLPVKALQCPESDRHLQCDYFYYPPKPNAADDTPIACDLGPVHYHQTHNVLRADSSVSEMLEADFQHALILLQNVDFAEALRKFQAAPSQK